MPSEFSSNIRQIARELKEIDTKTAAGVRRAIRKSVAIAATATTEAIKAAAAAEGLHQAEAATSVKVSFSTTSGGATIRTDQRKARYARPLEKGSRGSGGAYDRHPVFSRMGNDVSGPLPEGQSRVPQKIGPLRQGQRRYSMVYVNQPTRPYFYGTAGAMEPFNEDALNAAVDVALQEAGWSGVIRQQAAKKAAIRYAVSPAANRARKRRVRAAVETGKKINRGTKQGFGIVKAFHL